MLRRIKNPFATVIFCALAGLFPGAIAHFAGGAPLNVAVFAAIGGAGCAVAAVQTATGTGKWR